MWIISLSHTHAHTRQNYHTQHVLSLLQDDGPRDNPSDSEPSPITLHVDSLIIHRRDDGSFSIGGDKTHTHFHLPDISTSTSVLIHRSYTTRPIKCFLSLFSVHLRLPNSLLLTLFLHTVDTAAEAKPRKEGVLIDGVLSPVPEVMGGVCGVSKASQTQAPPTSPPPSTREKVRHTMHIVWEYTGTKFHPQHLQTILKVKISVTSCVFPPTNINC